MLIFANPAWLWVAAASAILGGWAIWRGQKRVRAVSSVRLWQGLAGSAGQPRRRAVDPLWLLIFAATLVAALGLAQPAWTIQDATKTQTLPVEWSVRSLGNAGTGGDQTNRAEAWLHLQNRITCPPSLTLTANGTAHALSAADLHRGIALRIANAGPRVSLMLQAEGQTLAEQTFVRNPAQAQRFALLEQTAAGHAIDPALLRLFSLQAGAHPGDPSIHPAVLLVNNPDFAPSGIPDASLVIAQPGTPMPGITPGSVIKAPAGGWTPHPATTQTSSALAWPSFAWLEDVRVQALRQATLSADWQVLATANNLPWLAARKWGDPENPAHQSLLIWLASDPRGQTNWPTIPTFVAFFAEMANRTFSSFAGTPSSQSSIILWNPVESAQASAPNPPLRIDLTRFAGAIALALIGAAVAWFVWRNQGNGERAG